MLAGDTNATSSIATLTVTPDTTPPTLSSVTAGGGTVSVIFGELMDTNSLGIASNYSIDQGLPPNLGNHIQVCRIFVSGATAGATHVDGERCQRASPAIRQTQNDLYTFHSEAFYSLEGGQLR
jgi:hypothetical protein